MSEENMRSPLACCSLFSSIVAIFEHANYDGGVDKVIQVLLNSPQEWISAPGEYYHFQSYSWMGAKYILYRTERTIASHSCRGGYKDDFICPPL